MKCMWLRYNPTVLFLGTWYQIRIFKGHCFLHGGFRSIIIQLYCKWNMSKSVTDVHTWSCNGWCESLCFSMWNTSVNYGKKNWRLDESYYVWLLYKCITSKLVTMVMSVHKRRLQGKHNRSIAICWKKLDLNSGTSWKCPLSHLSPVLSAVQLTEGMIG